MLAVDSNLPLLPLLPLLTLKKALKLSSYSRLTQSCIIYYKKNGRYVNSETMHLQKPDGDIQVKKRFKTTERQLAPRSIFNRLERFTSFMEKLNFKCIKEITP